MQEEYTFDGQRPGEKIRAVIKNHPLVLFVPGLKMVVAFAAAVAIVLFWSNEYSGLLAFVIAIVGLGIFTRFYYSYLNSDFVITDQRILDVNQTGFVARRISEAEIANIQSVASDTSGLIRTIFKYGSLNVKLSGGGTGNDFLVTDIPNPYEVQKLITNKN